VNKYEDLSVLIEKMKRPLILIGVGSLLANLVVVISAAVINRKVDQRKFSTIEACYFGMQSIFENNANDLLVHPDVIEDLAETKFKFAELALVKKLDAFSCDVVSSDSKGHRSYLVQLEKNSKFTHGFRIFDIKEQKLKSKYQWSKNL